MGLCENEMFGFGIPVVLPKYAESVDFKGNVILSIKM